jgi:hypothetical protein
MSTAAIEVITSGQRRRCWSAAEKERLSTVTAPAFLDGLWLITYTQFPTIKEFVDGGPAS